MLSVYRLLVFRFMRHNGKYMAEHNRGSVNYSLNEQVCPSSRLLETHHDSASSIGLWHRIRGNAGSENFPSSQPRSFNIYAALLSQLACLCMPDPAVGLGDRGRLIESIICDSRATCVFPWAGAIRSLLCDAQLALYALKGCQ
jgi:hypothetical protein